MAIRYSHPPENERDGVLLLDHLTDVANRSCHVVPDSAFTPNGEPVESVVKTLAYVHDLGKATTYFQHHILEGSTEPENSLLRHHAPIGSFAAYYALDVQGFSTQTCLAGFIAVGKHHGRLGDMVNYVFQRVHRRENVSARNQSSTERRQSAIAKQIKDIDDNVPSIADEMIRKATNNEGTWDKFSSTFADLLTIIESKVATSNGHGVDRNAVSNSCYELALECWGSLVLADKTSAASEINAETQPEETYKPVQPDFEQLDAFVADLEEESRADPNGSRDEQLNHHRSSARNTVIDNAKQFAQNGGGVATLTLPTGMGKTLSGLSAALTIRDELSHKRVVYALPFTSIIDQVVDELQEIHETDTAGRVLTAHHYLSDTTIEAISDSEKADLNDDVSGMLAESWRAGLTVTTFVQLFESLAGPTNAQSMKVPALRDCVIILDEPQSIPLDWWELVPRLVRILTERFGTSVIAMTATQPRLFEQSPTIEGEPTELVNNPDRYFRETQRLVYQLDPSTERYLETQEGPKSYDDATTDILSTVDAGYSTLAVCNTIDSAQRLTTRVDEARPDFTNVGEMYAAELQQVRAVEDINPTRVAKQVRQAGPTSILHLSTRVRPVDRLKLIETAKELTDSGHRLVTISTQLVEAGVDISFDHVYRDLAPIESIVQAAGRCNRSFEREQGTVTVWWLDAPGEQQKTPSEAVYNQNITLLPVVAETLESLEPDGTALDEFTVARTAVDRFYDRLHEEKNVGKKEFATYVDDARADELGDLSLIDKRDAVDVIICRTPAERQTRETIATAADRYDWSTVRNKMHNLRTKQVSIPIYRADSREARELDDLPPVHQETNIRWIDTTEPQYDGFFDTTTGFVVPDSTVERRFL